MHVYGVVEGVAGAFILKHDPTPFSVYNNRRVKHIDSELVLPPGDGQARRSNFPWEEKESIIPPSTATKSPLPPKSMDAFQQLCEDLEDILRIQC